MGAQKKHYCFQPPSDENIKTWRYMDFTKYVAMITTQSLYFARSDLLSDPYEGSTSHANETLRPTVYKDELSNKFFNRMAAYMKWVRQWTFINCWHMNEHESAAMWKLYSKTDEAVAIQTTYHKLRDCLPENIYIGIVYYIDYEKEWLPEGNTMWPYVHKRKSFEHERELRALFQEMPTNKKEILTSKVNIESGRKVPVDINMLVEKVYVSPESPAWYYALVAEVTKQYGLNTDVKQSGLSKEPIY